MVADSSILSIPLIKNPLNNPIQYIRKLIHNEGVSINISQVNWKDYPASPHVKLSLGYTDSHLWLAYEVLRDSWRVVTFIDHGPVWEDNCVEFFMMNEENIYKQGEFVYRNFEFNPLGICLSAVGTKLNRQFLKEDEMKTILRFSCFSSDLTPAEGDTTDWFFIAAIPLSLMGLHSGSRFFGNFFKCGDLTLRPHFLSWAKIDAPAPDFHMPQFFGKIELQV